jgi:peptidoglycan-associated lipoprotein
MAALLALGLLAIAGCSHKTLKSDVATDVTTPPTDTTPKDVTPPAETKTPSSDQGEEVAGYPDVYFAYDDASLDDVARGILSKSGAKLLKNSIKLEVQGHCDERGSVEYNLALGEKRANSVTDYLVSYGVPASRLFPVSRGKESPIDPGHDEAAWARNRRAHFVSR